MKNARESHSLQTISQETKFFNFEASAFLCNEIPPEKVSEVASILRGWRNRRTLRNISLRDLYENFRKNFAQSFLIYVLERKGVEEWKESCLAAWALGIVPMTDGDRKEACRVLRLSLQDRTNSFKDAARMSLGRACLRTLVVSSYITVAMIIVALASISPNTIEIALLTALAGPILISLLLFAPIYSISLAVDLKRKHRIQYFAAMSLGRLELPESVGALANASRFANRMIAHASYNSLLKVLPAVTANHYACLPDNAVRQLCTVLMRLNSLVSKQATFDKALGHFSETELEENMLIVFEALEKIGDSNALIPVRNLAQFGFFESVRRMAEKVLPILEERKRQENDKAMLLRGSAEPKNPETLLRPATASSASDATGLLRASATYEIVDDQANNVVCSHHTQIE